MIEHYKMFCDDDNYHNISSISNFCKYIWQQGPGKYKSQKKMFIQFNNACFWILCYQL